MTTQDLLLVAAMAGLAVAITLADLILSLRRHSRRVAGPRKALPGSFPVLDEAAAAARRESIRRRLAAIQSARGDSGDTPSGGRVRLN